METNKLKIEYLPIKDIHGYEHNAKIHDAKNVEHIANSIRDFGFRQPIAIDQNNEIVAGHGRMLAAQKLGLKEVPCIRITDLDDEHLRSYRLADNRTNESEWDFDLLFEELEAIDLDMSAFGFDVDSFLDLPDGTMDMGEKDALKKKFLVPPFSILKGNSPDWLERKRMWTNFGICSEVGRGGDLCFSFPSGWADKHPLRK